jgi:Glycosyltransferase family 87
MSSSRIAIALRRRFEWDRWNRPLLVGNAIAVAAAIVLMTSGSSGFGADAQAWWHVDIQHPYWTFDYGTPGGFFYSPAFAVALAPLGLLPWSAFLALIIALDITALGWLVGWRWIGYALLLTPVMDELRGPNIDIPLAAAIVLTFERPALWAFVLLTKVTPGIGILWFAVRRQWRYFAIAFGATVLIAGLSFMIAPNAWFEWVELLRDNASRPTPNLAFPVPLAARLPIAAIMVVYAARTNRRWLVSIAAFLAIAVIWRPHYVLLLGVIAAWRLARQRNGPRPATSSAASRLRSLPQLSRPERPAATGPKGYEDPIL